MIRKRFQLNLYQFTDGDAMARHVEKMHARGWCLERFSNLGWHYRRDEKERVHYAVTYFPAASVYDAGPTEEQMTYAEYCAAAGWEFVSAYGPMQFFRSREERPIPIETDEREKLRAIHRSMLKTHILSCGLLTLVMLLNLGSRWSALRYRAFSLIRSGSDMWLTGLLAFLLLCLLVMLGDYFLWYLRSRWAVAHGGACARNHWRLHLCITYGVLIAAAVCLTGYFASAADTPGGMVWAFLLIFAGAAAIIAAAMGLLSLLKRQGLDRSFVRGAYIAGAVVIALAYCGGIAFFLPRFMDAHVADGHVTEIYTYTDSDGETREHTLYRDPLPLTLEDLGVELPEDIPYSYHADPDRSPLAWGGEYRQEGAVVRPGQEMPPEISYSVTVFRWPWLRDLCCGKMLEHYDEGYYPYTLIGDPRWGAERVYRRADFCQYLLVYPDRAVALWLDGVELTEEQIAVIVDRLAT